MSKPVTGTAVLLALLGGCELLAPANEVEVGQLRLRLHTPAEVDPWAGTDTVRARVLDVQGRVLAEASGPVGPPLSMPELDDFGVVMVEITAREGELIRAVARSGPILLEPGVDRDITALFLPVNTAVPLVHQPVRARIDHRTVLAADGRVLLVGGREPGGGPVWDDTEWWSVEDGYAQAHLLPSPRFGMARASAPGHATFMVGGFHTLGPPALHTHSGLRLEATGDHQPLPTLVQPRAPSCLAPFAPGRALAIGGRATGSDPFLEILGGSDPSWSTHPIEGLDGRDVTGCAVTDGPHVVVVGTESWGVFDLLDAADDEIPHRYQPLPGSQPELEGPLVVPLPEGRAWVLGGWDGWDALTTTVFIDAATRVVQPGPLLGERRAWADWRWVVPGELLAVAGGYDHPAKDMPVASVELVHIEEGSVLSVSAPVREPRVEVLPDGSILLFGGVPMGGEAATYAIVPWVNLP